MTSETLEKPSQNLYDCVLNEVCAPLDTNTRLYRLIQSYLPDSSIGALDESQRASFHIPIESDLQSVQTNTNAARDVLRNQFPILPERIVTASLKAGFTIDEIVSLKIGILHIDDSSKPQVNFVRQTKYIKRNTISHPTRSILFCRENDGSVSWLDITDKQEGTENIPTPKSNTPILEDITNYMSKFMEIDTGGSVYSSVINYQEVGVKSNHEIHILGTDSMKEGIEHFINREVITFQQILTSPLLSTYKKEFKGETAEFEALLLTLENNYKIAILSGTLFNLNGELQKIINGRNSPQLSKSALIRHESTEDTLHFVLGDLIENETVGYLSKGSTLLGIFVSTKGIADIHALDELQYCEYGIYIKGSSTREGIFQGISLFANFNRNGFISHLQERFSSTIHDSTDFDGVRNLLGATIPEAFLNDLFKDARNTNDTHHSYDSFGADEIEYSTTVNYYDILDVTKVATSEEIKQAMRKKARQYHPDLNGSAYEDKMKQVNRAYAILSDKDERRKYDSHLSSK